MIVNDMYGGKEDMTKKRFSLSERDLNEINNTNAMLMDYEVG